MNFQNIPRKDTVVKKAILPKLDAFLMCDYKQIEPRLLAFYLSSIGDDTLAQYIRSGTDPYNAIVTQFLGRDDFTDEERSDAKIVFLSQMYGGGPRPIADAFECTWGEAVKITKRFQASWPGITRLQAAIGKRMEQRGYITTLWGRHLHPASEHVYINALIQGCAADLMKNALVKVHRYLTAYRLRSHLVSSIHDELILDAIQEELPRLTGIVPELMLDERINAVVPVEVDVEVSYTNWAEKAPYEQEQLAA